MTPSADTHFVVPFPGASKQPVYGYVHGSKEPVRFLRAEGMPDTFFMPDREVNLDDEIRAPLPKPPTETMLAMHWLAVEGVQPAIPENPAPDARQMQQLAQSAGDAMAAAAAGKAGAPGAKEAPTSVVPVVAHIISKELQLYFDKITELIAAKGVGGASFCSAQCSAPPNPHFSLWYFPRSSAPRGV